MVLPGYLKPEVRELEVRELRVRGLGVGGLGVGDGAGVFTETLTATEEEMISIWQGQTER